MPIAEFVQAAQSRLAKGGTTSPKLMPQVFASRNDQSGTQEDRRRRSEQITTPSTAVASLGGANPPAQSAMPAKIPAAPTVIDRLHKEAANPDGAYITVMLPHMASDVDQIPPLNPAYATSIGAAYAKAVAILPLLHPTARVTIKIMAGIYYETVAVASPRIDFEGWDRATIAGQVQVLPIPGIDTKFSNLDFIAVAAPVRVDSPPNPTGAVWLMPNGDINPLFPLIQFRNCNFFSDSVAMLAESRFYAENCHWFRTGGQLAERPTNYNETDVPLTIHLLGTEMGPTLLRGCSIHSRLRSQDGASFPANASLGGPLDLVPLGYAWSVRGLSQGTYNSGNNAWISPNASVQVEDTVIEGSLLCQEARVAHTNCDVHGGILVGSIPDCGILGSRTGGLGVGLLYASLRGRPLFDPANGYVGDNWAMVTFDSMPIRSFQVAWVLPYNGNYPPGVNPSTYPGFGYVQVNQSPHHMRWDGGPANAFGTAGGIGIATIVNSATSACSWTGGDFTATLFGSCPQAVPMFDFYRM